MFPTHQREPLNRLIRRPPWSYRRHYRRTSYDDYFETSWNISKTTGVLVLTIFPCTTLFLYLSGEEFKSAKGEPSEYDWIQKNIFNKAENVDAGRWWVMFNSSFAHVNLLHLGINMFTLWSFGKTFIEGLGVPCFAGLWVVAAFASSAADIYWQKKKKRLQMDTRRWDQGQKYTVLGIPISRERALAIAGSDTRNAGGVGSSGVLFGCLGVFLCVGPTQRATLLGIFSAPLWVHTAVFVGGSAYCLATNFLPMLGHAAHLGGTAAGVAYYFAVAGPLLRRIARR